jgi:hypothetical protein
MQLRRAFFSFFPIALNFASQSRRIDAIAFRIAYSAPQSKMVTDTMKMVKLDIAALEKAHGS